MKITIELHRRHLAVLPAAVATVVLVLTVGLVDGLATVAIVLAAYVGTALALAIGDHAVTEGLPRLRRRREIRRADHSMRQINRSARIHPSNIRPKHKRSKGAVAA